MATRQIHAVNTQEDEVEVTDDEGGALFSYSEGTLSHPVGIDFAADNSIWVGNYSPNFAHGLYHFDTDGTFLGYGGAPGAGSGDGEFNSIAGCVGLGIASDGSIVCVDSGNNRIQVFDSTGAYVTQWGTFGTGDGDFDFGGQGYLAINASDEIYVTDRDNQRVQKFQLDGTFVTAWGFNGTGDGEFTVPTGIAIAGNGDVYVVDDYWNIGAGTNSRVQWFTTNGVYLGQYDSPTYGSGDGEFEHPSGICFDTDGNIYIADEYNFRIQKLDESFGYLAQWPINDPQNVAARFGGAAPALGVSFSL